MQGLANRISRGLTLKAGYSRLVAGFWWRRPRGLATGSDAGLRGTLVVERAPSLLDETPVWEVEYAESIQGVEQTLRRAFPAEFTAQGGRGADAGKDRAAKAGKGDDDEFSQMTSLGVEDDESEDSAAELAAVEAAFEPAPRTTAADEANDLTALDRCLDRRLYLLVKGPDSDSWDLPSRVYSEDYDSECLGLSALRAYFDSLSPAAQTTSSEVLEAEAKRNQSSGGVSLFDSLTRGLLNPLLLSPLPIGAFGSSEFFHRALVTPSLAAALETSSPFAGEAIWVTSDELSQYLGSSPRTEYLTTLLWD